MFFKKSSINLPKLYHGVWKQRICEKIRISASWFTFVFKKLELILWVWKKCHRIWKTSQNKINQRSNPAVTSPWCTWYFFDHLMEQLPYVTLRGKQHRLLYGTFSKWYCFAIFFGLILKMFEFLLQLCINQCFYCRNIKYIKFVKSEEGRIIGFFLRFSSYGDVYGGKSNAVFSWKFSF